MNRKFLLLSAALTTLTVFSGCSSATKLAETRKLAAAESPLTYDDLKNFEELGIAILNRSVISNRIAREAKIQQELRETLARMDSPIDRSSNALSITTVGILGASSALHLLALPGMLIEEFGTQRSVTVIGTTTAVAMLSSAAVIGGESISRSTGLSGGGSIYKGEVSSAERKANEALAEARVAFERETREITDRYARIFSLSAAKRENLRPIVRARAIEESKRPGSHEAGVSINVPELMTEHRLITSEDYRAFQATITILREKQDEAAILAFTDRKNFGANLEIGKATLLTYSDWLTKARAELMARPAASQDAVALRTIQRALDDSRRLLDRLEKMQ